MKNTSIFCQATIGLLLSLNACKPVNQVKTDTRFVEVVSSSSGIFFQNTLEYTEELNPYTYKSFYNGGGVGIGDLDNDGLQDIIFTGNLVGNAVYRNLGNWQFEDVSTTSGLVGVDSWTSGVSIADVNGDGFLDVYLCKSGPPSGPNRRNELRINNGDWTFTDVSKEAGVNDFGLSVHAAFFDYDKDGDLDMYLLNNSIRSVGGYDIREGQREIRDSLGGNRLYRNELVPEGKLRFTDVSEEAGIYGSDIGFGLGVSIADVNQDSWPDIYVSNDFFERDYLYLNRGDGSFAERLSELAPELSLGAMGADIADLTGDAYPEIFVTEMRPASAVRMKSKTKFESWDKSVLAESKGYHRQFSRNTLLQNVEGNALLDISRQAGVAATDWSWGALAADLDNDGWRDLYVANGIYKDLLDQDYIHFVADADNIRRWIASGEEVIRRLVDSMPSEALSNYAFRNIDKGFAFADCTNSWGLAKPSFSNGSAYGDLDNDGDLDLVINTVNDYPLLYQNKTVGFESNNGNFLGISCIDSLSQGNVYCLGTQIRIWSEGQLQTAELSPFKGFMSTVDNRILFGTGNYTKIDSIQISWPDRSIQHIGETLSNQYITVYKSLSTSKATTRKGTQKKESWKPITAWKHRETGFDDFDKYPLLVEMISAEGPAFATYSTEYKDLIFVGGGFNQAGKLYQKQGDKFLDITPPSFSKDSIYEDVAATWIDIDSDGDFDLFVGSGGDEATEVSGRVRLRLYENRGGTLVAANNSKYPSLIGYSCGALASWDYDSDGDDDLVFGTHFKVGQYGVPAPSFLLSNDGRGNFKIANDQAGKDFEGYFGIRAIVTGSFYGTQKKELAIAQEYGPVSILSLQDGRLINRVHSENGLWKALSVADVDGDGQDELLAGNLGLNTVFRASISQPLKQHIGDFDLNGQLEQITTYWIDGEESVAHQLLDLVSQMPSLRKKFPRFSLFANAPTSALIDSSRQLIEKSVSELRSGLISVSKEGLSFFPFPKEAQTTCVRGFGYMPKSSGGGELFIAGNYERVKPEIGGQSGSTGVTISLNSSFEMSYIPNKFPPLFGETRGILVMEESILAIQNNNSVLQYAY